MHKKIAVLILFASIAVGLFLAKRELKKELKSGPEDSQFIILNWHHKPDTISLDQETEFTVRLKDKRNRPIENAKLLVEANMNHAGMIPIYTVATPGPQGTYKFKIKLSMHGEWILFLTITKDDGAVIKKEIFFKTN